MAYPPPPYEENLPVIGNDTWYSGEIPNYKFMEGFMTLGAKTIKAMFPAYGDFSGFTFNSEDILNFDDVDINDITWKNAKPLAFVVLGLLYAVLALIIGFIWCLCTMCCSKKSKKSRSNRHHDGYMDDDDDGGHSCCSVVTKVFMGVLLILFGVILLSGISMNVHFNNAVDDLPNDVNNTLNDADLYLNHTKKQIESIYKTSYTNLSDVVTKMIDELGEGEYIKTRLEEVGYNLGEIANSLIKALNEIDLEQIREDIKDVEEEVENAKPYVYGSLWGVLLVLVAVLVLFIIGSIMVCAQRKSSRSKGCCRPAFFLNSGMCAVFIAGFILMSLSLVLFVFSGFVQMFCTHIRDLENIDDASTTVSPTSSALIQLSKKFNHNKQFQDGYEVPNYEFIIESCKEAKSAYVTFNLKQVYRIEDILDLTRNFTRTLNNAILNGIENQNVKDLQKQSVEPILNQIKYYGDFVYNQTLYEVGRCEPMYQALDTTLDVFCYKVAYPVVGFWMTLAFLLLLFIPLLIFTVALLKSD